MNELQFDLSEDQEQAVEFVVGKLLNGEQQVLLTGSAGTGKTTIIKPIVDDVEHAFGKVLLAAPTNKAAQVIAQKTGWEAFTIHHLFGLYIEEVEGEKVLMTGGNSKLPEHFLLIVDECSMVNEELKDKIDQILSLGSTSAVLFIGDPYQLPPVGEAHSGTLGTKARYQLTQVMRQSEGSHIIELAVAIRDSLNKGGEPVFVSKFGGGDLVIEKDYYSYKKQMLDAFKNGQHTVGICYRNMMTYTLNRDIRTALYGENVQPFLAGESLVMCEPLLKTIEGIKKVAISNGDIVTIDEAKPGPEIAKNIQTTEITAAHHKMLVPNDWSAYDKAKSRLREDALARKKQGDSHPWKYYYGFLGALTDARHSYAITAHKSQGSTYQSVFVNAKDIQMMRDRRERLQALYVAITRGSERCVIYL